MNIVLQSYIKYSYFMYLCAKNLVNAGIGTALSTNKKIDF